MSSAGLACIARSTTDVVYVRTHGPGESLYAGSYSNADLQRWADRVSIDLIALFELHARAIVDTARRLIGEQDNR